MIRAVLHIPTNTESITKASLLPGERLQVGRDARADVPVPGDIRVSAFHFELDATEHAVYLHDLCSRNGTCVNGQLVISARLRDGDCIRAGRTEFSMEISGDSAEEHAEAPEMRRTVPWTKGPVPLAVASSGPATYEAQPSPSGLVVYRGQSDQIPCHELVKRLSKYLPCHLVLHRTMVEGSLLPPPRDEDYLYEWENMDAVRDASPELLACASLGDPESLFQMECPSNSHWGWFSKDPKLKLMARLRAASHGKAGDGDQSRGINGVYWPNVLNDLLMGTAVDSALGLVHDNEAILIRSADHSHGWKLHGRPDLAVTLKLCGLFPGGDQNLKATL